MPRMLVTCVQWYDDIHTEFLPYLLDCSSGSVNSIREMISGTIGTVFMFMGEKYNRLITNAVAVQIEAIVALVRQRRPKWSGRINLVPHSLGTSIVYDIMRRGQLGSMPINHVFCLGGNMGAYAKVSVDGEDTLREFLLDEKQEAKFHNIMHPFDALCYRIEPALDVVWKDVPSVQMPRFASSASRRMQRFWAPITGIFGGEDEVKSPKRSGVQKKRGASLEL